MRLRGGCKIDATKHEQWVRKIKKFNINDPKYKKKYDFAVAFINNYIPTRGSAKSMTMAELYFHYALTIEWAKCSKFTGRNWRKIEKVRRKTNDSESRYY